MRKPAGGCVLFFDFQPVIPGQGGDAAVVRGLPLLGEEAAGNSLVVVPVVGHAGTAFAVAGTVIGTRTGAGVVTGHR